jgi:nicotinate phosphoribosyltransferase
MPATRDASTIREQCSGLALFTDLYELAMLQAYFAHGMRDKAVFSLFARRLPPSRNYLLACGVQTLLDELERLHFSPDDLAYLASLNLFDEAFLGWLEAFRFTGDIFAMSEGTPFFANEPLLEVVAPIAEAQLIETLVLNQVGMQTLLASKAVRVVEAAAGRRVIDFGGRRAQGIDAAVTGARAFYIAGISATSNVLAGKRHGIPVAGTMAHSFIEACANEAEAFAAFANVFPETVLLVDTYDTLRGVRRVAELARKLGGSCRLIGVRLDSGDLLKLSREARSILDSEGLRQLQIIASGGLDEIEVDHLLRAGAPIDAFGLGTDMSVSADAPALDIAYKLTAYSGQGRLKLSTGKTTLPGRKQVYREFGGGFAVRDVIARHDEERNGFPLLEMMMKNGRRTEASRPLSAVRDATKLARDRLPSELRRLEPAGAPFPVDISDALMQDERSVRHQILRANAEPAN